MQIPVLIEPVAGNGFRARSAEPFGLTAEGATSDEALDKLRQEIQNRLTAGARLVSLDVPADNPWKAMAGIYKDDPQFDDWQQAIAEYRRQVEEDPDIP